MFLDVGASLHADCASYSVARLPQLAQAALQRRTTCVPEEEENRRNAFIPLDLNPE